MRRRAKYHLPEISVEFYVQAGRNIIRSGKLLVLTWQKPRARIT